MPRVDFYILQDQNRLSLPQFACRLADKVNQQGHRILMSADDDQTVIISHQTAEHKNV